jgi:hypothetical protein
MERTPLGYGGEEVDAIYPEETRQVLGVIVGDPFHRYRTFRNDEGKTVVTSEVRQVVVALLQDSSGAISFQAFDPGIHGELVDRPQIGLQDFLQDETYADPLIQQALTNVRKKGASRPVEGEGGYIYKQNTERGGDSSHPLPKRVFNPGKLA